ncbi:MAG: cobalamin-dependent protein, partial [Smithellaceae bacterium]|nr:cobalamin-dependent protein [Smithellaceae bacterium]
MKKNILLINPWIHDFAAYDLWMKPLGLLILGSILRKNGHTVSLVNCLNWQHPDLARDKGILLPKRRNDGRGELPRRVIPKPGKLDFIPRHYRRFGIPPEIFLNDLFKIARPDIILVTSLMTYWYPGVFEAIGLLRQVFPEVPVVLGGNYATLCPEHAKMSGADAIVRGEGERYLAGIFQEYLGIDLSFMPDCADLDSYPYPALDLLGTIDQVPLRTSRGCPYRCTYCASFVLHQGFSQRKPEMVSHEIDYWHKKQGVNHFSLYDDAF